MKDYQRRQSAAFLPVKKCLARSLKQPLPLFHSSVLLLFYLQHVGKYQKTKKTMLDTLDSLVKKGINIKVLCRVDIAGRRNVESLLSLNYKNGKEVIEIRHRHHPLRATIVDKQCFDMKEIKEPTGSIHELDKKIFIFYNVKDKEWVEWITRIFWKMFSLSIDANKRLENIDLLRVA